MSTYARLNIWGVWRERGEVKHLSTHRKRYSVSSGERKRKRPNRRRVIAGRRCVVGVVGPFGKLSLIHISEPTRRTPISYAVFCLKKKKQPHDGRRHTNH